MLYRGVVVVQELKLPAGSVLLLAEIYYAFEQLNNRRAAKLEVFGDEWQRE
jgi:hypothetical protein